MTLSVEVLTSCAYYFKRFEWTGFRSIRVDASMEKIECSAFYALHKSLQIIPGLELTNVLVWNYAVVQPK